MNDKLFESLNQSETGKNLVKYLEELCSKICDVRKMGNLNNEQRLELEKLIRSELIDKIQLRNPKKSGVDEYNNY